MLRPMTGPTGRGALDLNMGAIMNISRSPTIYQWTLLAAVVSLIAIAGMAYAVH